MRNILTLALLASTTVLTSCGGSSSSSGSASDNCDLNAIQGTYSGSYETEFRGRVSIVNSDRPWNLTVTDDNYVLRIDSFPSIIRGKVQDCRISENISSSQVIFICEPEERANIGFDIFPDRATGRAEGFCDTRSGIRRTLSADFNANKN